jgi:hypothetical protein
VKKPLEKALEKPAIKTPKKALKKGKKTQLLQVEYRTKNSTGTTSTGSTSIKQVLVVQ